MKVDRKKNLIRLSRADQKKWENPYEQGDKFRRGVRDIANGMARVSGKHVDIEAPDFTADQIPPPESIPGADD